MVYVVYGGYSLFNMDLSSLGDSGFTVSGNAQNSLLGYSVSGAGVYRIAQFNKQST